MCNLTHLSQDEFCVVVLGIYNPLEPRDLIALAETCKCIHLTLVEPLHTGELSQLNKLKQRYLAVREVCVKAKHCYSSACHESALHWMTKRITDNHAIGLTVLMRFNRTLTNLHLACNNIGYVGATAIAEALKVDIALTELSLSNNKIGHVGAKAIGDALVFNGSLNTLFLGRNRIGDIGASAIAEAIKANRSLTTLGLDQNKIGDSGAKAIGDTLVFNRALTKLLLYCNNIGDAGAAAIAEGLSVNRELKLNKLVVQVGLERHAGLVAACKEKGVELV